jgi:hypothetical protein
METVYSELSLANIVEMKVCNHFLMHNYGCYISERYDEFRQACCDYMIKDDSEFFKLFMEETSLEHYVENMRADGVWGTQLEIVSLCKKYTVHCVIFRPDGLHYTIECDNPAGGDCRILMISHHDEEHFNEVCFKEKGRVLSSFTELELLLTELDPGNNPQEITRLSKKVARQKKRENQQRRQAPEIVVSESNHKLINL